MPVHHPRTPVTRHDFPWCHPSILAHRDIDEGSRKT